MSTSVYLSNSIIQVTSGFPGPHGCNIKKVYELDMPEGSLINGMITNEHELQEQLDDFWKKENLPRTDVTLVINGLAFTRKHMSIPKLSDRKIMEVIRLEYENMEHVEDPVYDYVEVRKDKKNRGKLKEIATIRSTVTQLNSWVELFKGIGITVKSIVPSTVTIQKFFREESELKKGTSLILGTDDNTLVIFLRVDGEHQHTNSKRFFSNRGTPEFGVEAVNLLNDFIQYYRTLKKEEPVKRLYLYNMDNNSRTVIAETLKTAGLDLEIMNLPGKHGDVPALAGSFVNWSNDVDLLQAMYRKMKNDKIIRISYRKVLPPAICFILCIIISTTMGLYSYHLKKYEKELEAYCADPERLAVEQQADELNAEIEALQEQVTQIDTLNEMTQSYPLITHEVIKTIQTAGVENKKTQIVSYQSDTGVITMEAKVGKVEDCNRFVEKLRATGLFREVDYTGYRQNEDDMLYDVSVQGIFYEGAGR